MALNKGETPLSKFPGITRRFPIRLCERGVVLKPGHAYVARLAMHDSNPAFEAVYMHLGAYEGHLYDNAGKLIGPATDALYLHVLSEHHGFTSSAS